MAYNLVVLPRATDDVVTAITYYNAINNSLGTRFLNEIMQTYELLKSNPQYYSYTNSKKIFRDIKIPSFPYVAIFEIRGNEVILYAVKNTFTKPEKFIRK